MARPKILIFGGGPSAAFTLAAVSDYFNGRVDITVIGPTLVTEIPGTFMFHVSPIIHRLRKEVLPPRDAVHFIYQGTMEGYKHKQWGHTGNKFIETSWGKYGREIVYQPSWVLSQIWKQYKYEYIKTVLPLSDVEIGNVARVVDWSFITFPTQGQRAHNNGAFVQIPIVEVPFLGQKYTPNLVIYRGDDGVDFVRESILWGKCWREYPYTHNGQDGKNGVLHIQDLRPNYKPTLPPLPAQNMSRIGRMALMDSSVLAHDAYEEVYRELDAVSFL